MPLLCLGIAFTATSQVSFQKGYIVTSAGDTTKGYLKRSTYAELANTVEFRQDNVNTSSVTYTTQNLKAFAFDDGDLFETVSYADLSDSNKHRTEFARIALEGYYSVFILARQALSNYLIKSSDTTYLLYDDIIDKGMENASLHLGNYRNTLAFLSRNCSKVNTDFERIRFSKHDITQIVKQLNDCNQSQTVVYKHKEKLDKHLVVYAGAFMINNEWRQLSGGADLRLRNTALSRKVSFVTGLHYSTTTKIDSKYSFEAIRWITTKRITEVYSVPAILHYSPFERAVQPYIYFGFGAAYRKENIRESYTFERGLQGSYGVSIIGGMGVEVYPLRYIAIKADWRYELQMQHPTLGIAFRL